MNKSKKWEDDFRTNFLESLTTKKKDLEELLDRLKGSQRDYDGQLHAGDFTDEVDDAQREISAHQLYSLLERKNKELKNIERLIERISKEEDFGLCEECGKRIPRERLMIIPEATLCIGCQRDWERLDHALNYNSSGFRTKRAAEWETSKDSEDDEDAFYTEGGTGDLSFADEDDDPGTEETPDDLQ